MGTLEDGENDDKWITVIGNSKTKNLVNPKPKPKVHNAFAILSQPGAPTHYNVPSPTQQMDTTKPSSPQAHVSTAGNKEMPGATSNKHYGCYAKVTICSLTTASPMPRTNALPLLRTTPTMQSMWQSILPMHNATNQQLGLPNVAKIWPTAWVHVSFATQNKVRLFNATSTPKNHVNI
jgi:hypothetical protein